MDLLIACAHLDPHERSRRALLVSCADHLPCPREGKLSFHMAVIHGNDVGG